MPGFTSEESRRPQQQMQLQQIACLMVLPDHHRELVCHPLLMLKVCCSASERKPCAASSTDGGAWACHGRVLTQHLITSQAASGSSKSIWKHLASITQLQHGSLKAMSGNLSGDDLSCAPLCRLSLESHMCCWLPTSSCTWSVLALHCETAVRHPTNGFCPWPRATRRSSMGKPGGDEQMLWFWEGHAACPCQTGP